MLINTMQYMYSVFNIYWNYHRIISLADISVHHWCRPLNIFQLQFKLGLNILFVALLNVLYFLRNMLSRFLAYYHMLSQINRLVRQQHCWLPNKLFWTNSSPEAICLLFTWITKQMTQLACKPCPFQVSVSSGPFHSTI